MPVKQGLASLEDGFRVRYLGSLGFANGSKKPGIQTLQRPMLQLYSAARRRGEDRRSTHSLALTQFLDVSDYGLVVVDIEEDPEDGELSPVITKVITPVQNVILWAAVRFHTRPNKRKSMGAAFVPIACSDGVLDKNSFVQLGSKQRFLVSLTHPPLFVCLLQRVSNPKSVECHAFVCSTAEDALSISSMVGGSKEERGPSGTLGYFTGPKSSSHTFKSSRDLSHSEEDVLSTSTLTPSSITTAATSSRMTVDSRRVSRAHYANGAATNGSRYERSKSCPRPAPDESSLDYAEIKRDRLSPLSRRSPSPIDGRINSTNPLDRRRVDLVQLESRREMSPVIGRRSPILGRKDMSSIAAQRDLIKRKEEFSPVLGRRDEQSPIIGRRGDNGYRDSPVLGRRYENGFGDKSQTPRLSRRFVQSKVYDKRDLSPPQPPKRRSKSLGRHVITPSPDFQHDSSRFQSYRAVHSSEDDLSNANHNAKNGGKSQIPRKVLPSYQFGQQEKSFQTNSENSDSPTFPNHSDTSSAARKPREMVTMSHTVDFSSEGESTVRNSYVSRNGLRNKESTSYYRKDPQNRRNEITQQYAMTDSINRKNQSPVDIRDAGTMTERAPKRYVRTETSDQDDSSSDLFKTKNVIQQEASSQTLNKRSYEKRHSSLVRDDRRESFLARDDRQTSSLARDDRHSALIRDDRQVRNNYSQHSEDTDFERLGTRVEHEREYAQKMGDTGLYRMVKENRPREVREYNNQHWESRHSDPSSDSEINGVVLKHPEYLRNTDIGVWVHPSLFDHERDHPELPLPNGSRTRKQYVSSGTRYEVENAKRAEKETDIDGNGTSRVTIAVPYYRDVGSQVSDCSYKVPHGVRSYHRRDQVRNWSTVSVTSDQSYQGSSTLPLAKSRHQNTKVIRWSSVEDLPRRRGFITSIKKFSVRSLTRAKKKTGQLLNSLKARMKSDKSAKTKDNSAYDRSEVCLRPDGNGNGRQKLKKKKRRQSWSFHDLRTEFPTGRPTRRRHQYVAGSQNDLLERNGSPGGSGNSNNSARELISRNKKKREQRYDTDSSDSGVEEYPSDFSDAAAAAQYRARRAKPVPRKYASEVTLLNIDSAPKNSRDKRNNGRWSQTDLHGELGYIP